jgi:hypothetical protein
MMGADNERILEAAAQFEHPDFRELKGGEWYIDEKIVHAPDDDQRRDNDRVLKYAYIFSLNGAEVEFVREHKNHQTPDLKVTVNSTTFYVEVKKFGLVGSRSNHPVSKIVSAVTGKKRQLPDHEMGFVAIDNFDIKLELDGEAMTHDAIEQAIAELERLAAANRSGWRKPSGVIIAASSTGGIGVSIPHFIWLNNEAKPAVPNHLADWIRRLFRRIDEDLTRAVLQITR